jgi:uncharacterized membrane protein YeaQ/YmgE (transglycosylase-associated protein family)
MDWVTNWSQIQHNQKNIQEERMGIILWIIFGAIAGWLASVITKRNDQMGCLTNIVVGILGAVIGGWIAGLLGFGGISGFNLGSLIIAVLGAVVLLLIVGFFQRR